MAAQPGKVGGIGGASSRMRPGVRKTMRRCSPVRVFVNVLMSGKEVAALRGVLLSASSRRPACSNCSSPQRNSRHHRGRKHVIPVLVKRIAQEAPCCYVQREPPGAGLQRLDTHTCAKLTHEIKRNAG